MRAAAETPTGQSGDGPVVVPDENLYDSSHFEEDISQGLQGHIKKFSIDQCKAQVSEGALFCMSRIWV